MTGRVETVSEMIRALADGSVTSVELVTRSLDRIEKIDPTVGAFLSVDREGALAAARESDKRRKQGAARGALDGVPFAVKDNINVAGLPMTCGSRILDGYRSVYDATAVGRLRAAGAIPIGKTNLDEFGMGSSTEHSAYRVTKNPHDPNCVPGGSSGGSAAAVASGEVPFALGSDTGGSVRQPAAFCGTVGFKPSYGRVSRYGLTAFASSTDCVGVLAPTAEDAAIVFSIIGGRDVHDMTSIDASDLPIFPFDGLRLARFPALEATASPAVRDAVERVISLWQRKRAASVTIVDLPDPEQILSAYYVISSAEASSNLSRFDGVRYGCRRTGSGGVDSLVSESRGAGFGEEVKRRILFGTDLLTAEKKEIFYRRALHARRRLFARTEQIFAECDLLLTPTAPSVAFPIGSKTTPDEMYRSDLCTVYASLAGLPAISIPVGFDDAGLPLAVQLTAKKDADAALLAAARETEAMLR